MCVLVFVRYKHMSVQMCTFLLVHVEIRAGQWGGASPSNFLHPIALRQSLSLSWEIIVSFRLAGQEALKIYLSLPPTTNAGLIGMCSHVT